MVTAEGFNMFSKLVLVEYFSSCCNRRNVGYKVASKQLWFYFFPRSIRDAWLMTFYTCEFKPVTSFLICFYTFNEWYATYKRQDERIGTKQKDRISNTKCQQTIKRAD